MNDVLVVGAGAWGTALAVQAARAGNRVRLWARDPARAEAIARDRVNPRLPGVTLPSGISVTTALDGAADFALLAVPLQHMRGVAERVSCDRLVACAKGVETGTGRLALEILESLHPAAALAVLTGPNFAHEIATGLPAASVIASRDPALRALVMDRLSTATFRLYGNGDPIGAQLGGAGKNVVAIAAGAAMGAGLGENARAALMTRGVAELARLAGALGGRRDTVAGLSGLGDLLLTCTGLASRNYRMGLALGRRETPRAALAGIEGVVEGVATAPALLARAGTLELPLCGAVAALLDGRTTVAAAMDTLLSRPRKDE